LRLAATDNNIVRLKDIQSEIQPQIERLKHSMKAADRRKDLASRIDQLRQRLVNAQFHEIETGSVHIAEKEAQLKISNTEAISSRDRLIAEIETIRAQSKTRLQAQSAALADLNILEEERDTLAVKIAEQQNRLAKYQAHENDYKVETARLHELEVKTAQAQSKIDDLESELKNNAKAAQRTEAALAKANDEIKRAEEKLVQLRGRTADGSQRQYVDHALSLVKTIAQHLNSHEEPPMEQLRLLVHKTGRLLSYASKSGELDVLEELKTSQKGLEGLMRKRETSLEHQSNITLSRRSLELDMKFHRDELDRLETDSKKVADVLEKIGASTTLNTLAEDLHKATARFGEINTVLAQQRKAISGSQLVPDSDIQADKAAELERTKAKLETIAHQLSDLSARQTQIVAAQSRLDGRLHEWGLKPVAESGNISELERTLASISATYEAESAHASEIEAELNQTSQRDIELGDQLADLESGQANLREVITHLDLSIRERFDQNFAGISEHFNRSFARLFDGGSAGLQLIREDNGDYGITIKVNPKGKRLSSLEVLSGGERALAGVALLAAILEVNPSPFIVLDEIDAALDEANSGRLAIILRELSTKSQLIVITHNRQTMEAAKVLFGVSMNDQHISHLLSLRLEEAAQLAAR
jgi:chromosome segregation protein